MSILSLEFLVFILAALIIYYILPLKIRCITLLAASGVFIALSGWYAAAHLGAVSLLTYTGGLAINAAKEKKQWLRRLILWLFILPILGAMLFIKFEPALAGWINSLSSGSMPILPVWELASPIGLSYYTFMAVGLLTDIYRGKANAYKNPVRVFLFTGFFAQLPQGPVSSYKELGKQLFEGHRFAPDNFVSGFQLMLWGFFKKLVIADRLASTTDALLKTGDKPGWFVLAGVILYTIRLYADFSGGMDVVRGVSRMFGIELPINFKRPFFAVSVADYWRRWHITLGTWFKSYVMYPIVTSRFGIRLGRASSKLFGKKTGTVVPTALATFVVFLFIGVWHIASWNAVIYGAYFGFVMAASILLEPLFKTVNRTLNLPKKGWMTPVKMARTWFMILPAQYFAFTTSPAQGIGLFINTFTAWNFAGFSEKVTAVMNTTEWIVAGAALLILLAADILRENKIDLCSKLAKTSFLIRWPLLILLILIILVFGVYGEGYDSAAFLYTNF